MNITVKRALCLILAALLSPAFAACSDKPEEPAVTGPVTHAYDPAADGTAGELSVVFKGEGEDTAGADLSLWSSGLVADHVEDDAPQSAEIEVMGKKFTGEYSYSAVFYPATHLSHFYTCEYGGFAVNAETGAIDSLNLSYAKTEQLTPAENCRARAEALAATFIDVGEYVLTVREANVDEGVSNHYFVYTKYVEGIPTNDKLSIGMSAYGGGLASIGSSLVGSFAVDADSERAVRRLLNADVEGAIDRKAAGRFGEGYSLYLGDKSAIRLPDGTVALFLLVEITEQKADDYDGETYFYPATSAFDTFVFEAAP